MSNDNDVLTVTTVDPDQGVRQPEPAQLPPLTVSALMVTKADLVQALRAYIPHLADIEVIDGDRFLLRVGADSASNGGH